MAAKPARRWYQFSLRTLLVLMSIAGVPPAAYYGYQRYLVAKRLAEIESTFAWLQSLGYPRLHDARPIRITTRHWYGQQDPSEADASIEPGFLLSEGEKSFSVLTPALRVITVDSQSRDELDKSETVFEHITMPALARLVLERDKARQSDPFFDLDIDSTGRFEVLVVAWACARNGYPDLAVKLYEKAEATPEHGDKEGTSLPDRLAADIAHMETWRATLLCETQMPRSELLERFRWLKRHFPQSKHAADVAAKVTVLETMVAEDERHARERAAGLPLEQLPQSKQIAELIFQLRDQNGHQFTQPGWCDVLWTGGREVSPGHQLLAHGFDAVPQLADALSDQRLTRSVGFHRNFYFSHRVLTVGDAALQILERIAGRNFEVSVQLEGRAARADARREKVLAWHAELVAKGERAYLIEAVERCDDASIDMADRLIEKYPDEACLAIQAAIHRAADPDRRKSLIDRLGHVVSDASVPLLLAESQHWLLSIRLAAARALTNLGRPEGIDTALREWRSSEQLARLKGMGPFLATCGREEAVQAVAQRFSQLPIDERLETMARAVDEEHLLAAKPEYRQAVIRLLLVALADTEVREGMSGSYGDKSFSDPRVCDLAGYHLNCLDPAMFRFDLGQALNQREAARLAILAAR